MPTRSVCNSVSILFQKTDLLVLDNDDGLAFCTSEKFSELVTLDLSLGTLTCGEEGIQLHSFVCSDNVQKLGFLHAELPGKQGFEMRELHEEKNANRKSLQVFDVDRSELVSGQLNQAEGANICREQIIDQRRISL